MPCPALEPALHAQPVILYIAVPFGFPFGLAFAGRMYIPVGGEAPSFRHPLRCIPVFPMGAPGCCACVVVRCSCSRLLASRLGLVGGVPGSLCSVPCRASRLGLAVFRAMPCFAAPVVCASASQGGCRRSGWFGLMPRRPLGWHGGSLAPPSSSPPQAFCDPVPWCSTFSEATPMGAGVTFVPQPPALGYNMLAGCVP